MTEADSRLIDIYSIKPRSLQEKLELVRAQTAYILEKTTEWRERMNHPNPDIRESAARVLRTSTQELVYLASRPVRNPDYNQPRNPEARFYAISEMRRMGLLP